MLNLVHTTVGTQWHSYYAKYTIKRDTNAGIPFSAINMYDIKINYNFRCAVIIIHTDERKEIRVSGFSLTMWGKKSEEDMI